MRGHRRAVRTEPAAGFTLVELLITVALLGLLSTAFGMTLSGVIIDSASNRDASVLDAEARHASDAMRAMPYHICTQAGDPQDPNDPTGPKADYQNKMPAENDRPTNVDIIVDWVHYGNGTPPPADNNILANCPQGVGPLNGDQGVQVVKITVKFDDDSLSLDRLVVKRAQ